MWQALATHELWSKLGIPESLAQELQIDTAVVMQNTRGGLRSSFHEPASAAELLEEDKRSYALTRYTGPTVADWLQGDDVVQLMHVHMREAHLLVPSQFHHPESYPKEHLEDLLLLFGVLQNMSTALTLELTDAFNALSDPEVPLLVKITQLNLGIDILKEKFPLLSEYPTELKQLYTTFLLLCCVVKTNLVLELIGYKHRHAHFANFTVELLRRSTVKTGANLNTVAVQPEDISYDLEKLITEPDEWELVVRMIDWDMGDFYPNQSAEINTLTSSKNIKYLLESDDSFDQILAAHYTPYEKWNMFFRWRVVSMTLTAKAELIHTISNVMSEGDFMELSNTAIINILNTLVLLSKDKELQPMTEKILPQIKRRSRSSRINGQTLLHMHFKQILKKLQKQHAMVG